MTDHAVVIAGGGPAGLMLAAELALAKVDGYVAWVGDLTQMGLADALTTWFGPPTGDEFASRPRSYRATGRAGRCSGHATGRNATQQRETDRWRHGSL